MRLRSLYLAKSSFNSIVGVSCKRVKHYFVVKVFVSSVEKCGPSVDLETIQVSNLIYKLMVMKYRDASCFLMAQLNLFRFSSDNFEGSDQLHHYFKNCIIAYSPNSLTNMLNLEIFPDLLST